MIALEVSRIMKGCINSNQEWVESWVEDTYYHFEPRYLQIDLLLPFKPLSPNKSKNPHMPSTERTDIWKLTFPPPTLLPSGYTPERPQKKQQLTLDTLHLKNLPR